LCAAINIAAANLKPKQRHQALKKLRNAEDCLSLYLEVNLSSGFGRSQHIDGGALALSAMLTSAFFSTRAIAKSCLPFQSAWINGVNPACRRTVT
jgi:hypothetical protein